MVDPAGPRSPAAFEVHAPAAYTQRADAPALARDDRAQEPERVGAVAFREQRGRSRNKRVWSRAVICELPQIGVAGAKRVIPAARARRCRPAVPTRTKIALAASSSEARIIGRQQCALVGGQRPGARGAQLGDEQHRLHDAGRREDLVEADAADAGRRAHAERDRAGSRGRVPPRRGDTLVPSARERRVMRAQPRQLDARTQRAAAGRRDSPRVAVESRAAGAPDGAAARPSATSPRVGAVSPRASAAAGVAASASPASIARRN